MCNYSLNFYLNLIFFYNFLQGGDVFFQLLINSTSASSKLVNS